MLLCVCAVLGLTAGDSGVYVGGHRGARGGGDARGRHGQTLRRHAHARRHRFRHLCTTQLSKAHGDDPKRSSVKKHTAPSKLVQKPTGPSQLAPVKAMPFINQNG